MTEKDKIEKVRNSSILASKMTNNMVVYYNNDGLVFAEINGEVCPNYNPANETYMVEYAFSGLAEKLTHEDLFMRVLTEFPNVRGKLIKWLQRPDKTDANCPVTYADVFIHKLFSEDDSLVVSDDDVEDRNKKCGCHCDVNEELYLGINNCIASILETINLIIDELTKR